MQRVQLVMGVMCFLCTVGAFAFNALGVHDHLKSLTNRDLSPLLEEGVWTLLNGEVVPKESSVVVISGVAVTYSTDFKGRKRPEFLTAVHTVEGGIVRVSGAPDNRRASGEVVRWLVHTHGVSEHGEVFAGDADFVAAYALNGEAEPRRLNDKSTVPTMPVSVAIVVVSVADVHGSTVSPDCDTTTCWVRTTS
jgi:hypothetical protein